jgi:hypothetical protein
MHAQRRQYLQRRLVQCGALTFDFQLCLAFVHEQQLAQIRVPVGLDFPLVFPTPPGNGFTVIGGLALKDQRLDPGVVQQLA